MGRSAQTSTEPTCPAGTPVTLERSHCGGMSSKIIINFVTFVKRGGEKEDPLHADAGRIPSSAYSPSCSCRSTRRLAPPDRDERYGTTLNHRLMVGPTVISLVGDHVAGRERTGECRTASVWRADGRGVSAPVPATRPSIRWLSSRRWPSGCRCPFPTSLVHALSLAVDTLLRRAYARPEMRGRYAGRVSLRCDATGWPSWERSISFREPAGTWESASYAVRSRLESAPPDTPVEEVTLISLQPDLESTGPRWDSSAARAGTGSGGWRRRSGGCETGWAGSTRCTGWRRWLPGTLRRRCGPCRCPWTPRRGRPSGRFTRRSPWRSGKGVEREPVSVLYGRRWRRVARIDDRWMFNLWWLPRARHTHLLPGYIPRRRRAGHRLPRRVEWTVVPAERLTASEDERRSRWTFIPTGGSDDHTPDLAVEDLA